MVREVTPSSWRPRPETPITRFFAKSAVATSAPSHPAGLRAAMILFASLRLPLAEAHPDSGRTSVVRVMKTTRCPSCIAQRCILGEAQLVAPVVGSPTGRSPQRPRSAA